MKKYLPWILVAIPVFVFVSSLPFKFTGAADTQHIFGTIGQWISDIGLGAIGGPFVDYGAYVVGGFELIASVMLIVPKTRLFGALLGTGLLSGAVFFHLFTPLGIAVQFPGSDSGDPSLFVMAVLSLLCCVALVYLNRGAGPHASVA